MAKAVTGTREWAASSVNIQLGCSHNCLYCYAHSSALRFNRVQPGEWENEVMLPKLLAKNFGKRTGTIMFPTTHDITLANEPYSVETLRKMLAPGNHVLVVSKPHKECIETICKGTLAEFKDQILFRFTIGAESDETLAFWEPGAPGFWERYGCLTLASDEGFATSVSMEPLLATEEDEIVRLVEAFTPHVTDSIWLGMLNRPEERLKRNGFWTPEVQEACRLVVESQSKERIKALYERIKDHEKVKWKESIKAVVGLDLATKAGQDE